MQLLKNENVYVYLIMQTKNEKAAKCKHMIDNSNLEQLYCARMSQHQSKIASHYSVLSNAMLTRFLICTLSSVYMKKCPQGADV